MSRDHVNLLPKGLQKSTAPDLQRALVSGWIAALVIITLLTFMKLRDAGAKEAHYHRLAEMAKSMGASVQEITSKVKTTEEANRKFKDTKDFLESRITWTEALKELSLLIPKSVWLTNLATKSTDEREHYLEFIGEAPSQAKVASFLDTLESSYYFRDVVLRKSEKLQDFAPDLYQFVFEVDVPQLKPRGQSAKAK